MNKSIVRCRCGHQVLAKEVLRTDLYERRASEGSGREYVYVKFRCRRCKRMGEAFVAENRWDWSILEAEHNELSETERDNFLDAAPISTEEILDFHRELENFSLVAGLDCAAYESRDPLKKEAGGATPDIDSSDNVEASNTIPASPSSNTRNTRGTSEAIPPSPSQSAPPKAAPPQPDGKRQTDGMPQPPDDPLARRS